MHVVYMGGAHGNEIIGVDFVTQMMKNLALGVGDYKDFNPDLFTIDFIPCQNPEGYFTTTYALDSVMKNMNEDEIEKFSKQYYLAYREDNKTVIGINSIIGEFCNEYNISQLKDLLIKLFWAMYRNKPFSEENLVQFIIEEFKLEDKIVREKVDNLWRTKIGEKKQIGAEKSFHLLFDNVSLDCIPLRDEEHIKLKNMLEKLYSDYKFPMSTLANFFANASGVNLNDNTENYFNYLNEQIAKEGIIYANLANNDLPKSIPGPIGVPSENREFFEYTEENKALLNYFAKKSNYAFVNCHGTGGLFYLYPVHEDDSIKAHAEGVERDFSFYINSRIATEYLTETGKTYEKITGKYDPYKSMGHPEHVFGFGDLLRKNNIGSFMLELSKAGGNPIAPYCDKEANYKLTMEANMNASMRMLETILELQHLYDSTYKMRYVNDNVIYEESTKER